MGPLLVVGQLAVSLALIAAGGLFVRGAINAGTADPGFVIDHHLLVSMDPSLAGVDTARTSAIYRSVLDRARATPGVEHASLASIVPFGEFREGRRIRMKPADDGVAADFLIVGSDYFDTLGMHVLRGREFTRSEEAPGTTAASAIIDRLLAKKLFADREPLGQQILVSGREGEPSQARTVVRVVTEMMFD